MIGLFRVLSDSLGEFENVRRKISIPAAVASADGFSVQQDNLAGYADRFAVGHDWLNHPGTEVASVG